jgi:hypothetical protein
MLQSEVVIGPSTAPGTDHDLAPVVGVPLLVLLVFALDPGDESPGLTRLGFDGE